MPFKSGKQRRYLWANEPEIARDWTDRYGAAGGGIMNTQRRRYFSGAFGQGAGDRGGDPRASRAQNVASGHVSGQGGVHMGEGFKTHTTAPGTLSDPREKQDYFKQSWTGPKGWFGGGGYQNLKTPGVTAGGHQSRFGIGNLFRGAMGMFGGIPGRVGSMLSRIDPRQLRGKNPAGGWNTQQQYEDARNLRRDEKRMANMLRRRGLRKDYGEQNLYDLSGGQYDFREDQFGENQAGITGTDVAQEFDINAKSDIAPEFQHLIQNVNMSDAQKEKALLELERGVDPHIIMPKLQQLDPTKFFMKTDERIKSQEFIDFLEKKQGRKLSDEEKRKIYKAAKEDFA